MATLNIKLISEISPQSQRSVWSYLVEYIPVGAPGDGGDKANVREEDGVFFDAIQGIVHLTEWQSVQLELELHLTQRQYSEFKKQSI